MLTALGVLASLANATPALAVDVGDYEAMLSSSAIRDIRWYLKGVGDAYGVANAALAASGRPPLFCPPPQVALGAEELQDLVKREMDSPAGPQLRQRKVPVEVIVLGALQKTYPCPAR